MLGYLRDRSAGSLLLMQVRQASADGQAVIRRWDRDLRNVAVARAELMNALARWGLGEVSDSAMLVLSELLTNSLRHTQIAQSAVIETHFLRIGDRLRIEVHDGADAWPMPRPADVESVGGRGLVLVDAVADAWDVMSCEGHGKVVWAEFGAPSGEGTAHGA